METSASEINVSMARSHWGKVKQCRLKHLVSGSAQPALPVGKAFVEGLGLILGSS